jgi:hypothetical protein
MRKQILRFAVPIILFIVLTILTQIGGFIYLLCFPVFRFFNEKFGRQIWRILLRMSVFALVYGFATFIVVPPLAVHFGRVPMPYNDDSSRIQPWNFGTILLNRHYVLPNLKAVTEGTSEKLRKTNPGAVITYLDCGFPFFDGFRLYPHLSHNDGRKIDLSFFYLDAATRKPTNERPSWLGYGICEEPRSGEEDRPTFCQERGFWQYNFMRRYVIPQGEKHNFLLDERRTRELMRLLLADNRVQLLLVEPHLEKRLGFANTQKVRTPPCESVRHDDHIHVAIY